MITNHKGSVLVYIVFVMLLISLISLGLLYISLEDNIISYRSINNTSSYYMAEYKLNLALHSDTYYNIIKNKIDEYLKYKILSSRIYLRDDDFFHEDYDKIVFLLVDETNSLQFKVLSTSTYDKSKTKLEALIDPFLFFNDIYNNKIVTNLNNIEENNDILIDDEITNKYTKELFKKFSNENLLKGDRVIPPGEEIYDNIYIHGNLKLEGSPTSPTVINGLVYTKGNLTISSDVFISGILVVDGDIIIDNYFDRNLNISGMLIYNSTVGNSTILDHIDVQYDIHNINNNKVLYKDKVLRDKPVVLSIKKVVN